jgi:hypothetical protein
MTREELLRAQAHVQRALSELTYTPVAGVGLRSPDLKPALRERLEEILSEIDRELANLDSPNAAPS